MEFSEDYRDLFKILNKYKVKYLMVGGYAVIYYTEPRYTKDIDVWVKADRTNADKVYKALKEFGAPLHDITTDDFQKKDIIYQIGVAPIRVDIITGVKAVDFSKAWKKRKKIKYAEVPVNMIALEDLIKTKTAIKRPQDLIDIENLITIKKKL